MSKFTGVKSKPVRNRNVNLRDERDRKRAEAQVRQGIYDALTLEQKVAKLGNAPAAKERHKLYVAIKARDEAAKVAKAPKVKKAA